MILPYLAERGQEDLMKIASMEKSTILHTVLWLILLGTSQLGAADQFHNSNVELQQDTSQLESLRQSGDLDSLERAINRNSVKWRKRNHEQFIKYMFEACNVLSSYDIGDISTRAMLLSNYAISVLRRGNLTLEENVQFVEFLSMDPPEINEKTWKVLREQKARLWLAAWRRVADSIDPTFSFDEQIHLNVPTPPGSGLPAGASPESIKDSKMRAEYERAIAENSAKTRRLNEQYYLQKTAPRFFAEAERYFVYAYSRSPLNLSELNTLLAEFISDPVIRKRVSDEVRKGEQ
jgi:hypothetical protein